MGFCSNKAKTSIALIAPFNVKAIIISTAPVSSSGLHRKIKLHIDYYTHSFLPLNFKKTHFVLIRNYRARSFTLDYYIYIFFSLGTKWRLSPVSSVMHVSLVLLCWACCCLQTENTSCLSRYY